MEGYFTFVPGTINEPTGPKFNVRIAKFHLQQFDALVLGPNYSNDLLDW